MTATKQPRTRSTQQGVVLIVVMIMLVIIGLSSAAVMRSALEADLISANVRSEALATEGAQTALAFCEQQVINSATVPRVAVAIGAVQHWQVLANWLPEKTTTLEGPFSPTDWSQLQKGNLSGSASATTAVAPQCMAEFVTLATVSAGAGAVVRVTARGFTPDYVASSDGQTTNGAAVWVQSTLQLAGTF